MKDPFETRKKQGPPASSPDSPGSVLLEKYYRSLPQWVDGTAQFEQMIRSRVSPGFRILDVGAGSGRTSRHQYRDCGARLVGIDRSSEVLENPHLDAAHCCDAAHMPFSDGEFDLAFSDYVFEHLEHPPSVIREIWRVLKMGGHVLLRTPNKWHYVPMLARLLPAPAQERMLAHFTLRKPEDVFPKFYRCNTARAVREAFEAVGFTIEELLLVEKEPSYFLRSPFWFRAGVAYERMVNSTGLFRHLRSNIFAAFRK